VMRSSSSSSMPSCATTNPANMQKPLETRDGR
jgi:hypothetical protein